PNRCQMRRRAGRRHMVRSTSQRRTKWALAMRREMQIAIGQQLCLVRELPKELPPELASLLIRKVKEHDPYYDVVGYLLTSRAAVTMATLGADIKRFGLVNGPMASPATPNAGLSLCAMVKRPSRRSRCFFCPTQIRPSRLITGKMNRIHY